MVRVSKLAVIRLKGSVDVSGEAEDTLRMLNLNRPNQCVLIDDDDSKRGMLQKVKEKVTWGEIDSETLEKLINERGEFEGGKSVTDELVGERTPYDSVKELAEAFLDGDVCFDDIEGFQEVFRLHPPRKGYDSTRRSFHHGGSTGNREEAINELIIRMV